MPKNFKVVGKCLYCGDPIYDFHPQKDGMHAGCAQIVQCDKDKGGA